MEWLTDKEENRKDMETRCDFMTYVRKDSAFLFRFRLLLFFLI